MEKENKGRRLYEWSRDDVTKVRERAWMRENISERWGKKSEKKRTAKKERDTIIIMRRRKDKKNEKSM